MIAAAFIALAIGAAAAPHKTPELGKYGSAVHGPRPAPDCRKLVPACPPRRPAQVFPYRLTDAVVNLYAPAEDADPIIDPEEAEDIAWQEDSSGMGADYQVAILAAYEDGTIVWIVDYIGGCVTRSSQGVCADSASVAIDAVTGEFIASGVPGV